MKKNIFVFCTFLLSIFAVVSCDNATSVSEGYLQGLYTVDRNFLRPEMVDTFYKVDNVADFGLVDGDRAYITLAYEIDNYFGPSMAKYRIKSVEGKIPVSGLTAAGDVDASEYSSAILGFREKPMYGWVWLWNKYQNVSVTYYSNGSLGDFKLTPAGLSGDTLCFALNAKIEAGDEYVEQLMSFDVSSYVDILSADDAAKLIALDSLNTKLTFRWYDERNDTVKVRSIVSGKFKNCF